MELGWQFRRMGRAEINEDPFQNEFFAPEGLTDGLVRETIQNSLDAATSNEQPVRVRYTFPSLPLDQARARPYLEGLRAHLPALPEPINVDGPLDFLVVEDFNTRGLRGSPLQEDDDPIDGDGVRNDFYYFWRNIGRSNKSDTDRGRWGLGKTVFPASSRINSFWGVTIREDGQAYLMGQAVLKIHKVDGRRYAPYGYFGLHDDDFCKPVDSRERISEFKHDFGLSRTDEAGLSVVIPFIRSDDLRPKAVLKSAVVHFFHAILAGDLVVEIAHESKIIVVDRKTIGAVVTDHIDVEDPIVRQRLMRLFDLAGWSLSLEDRDHVELGSSTGAPRWDLDLIPQDLRPALRERLDRGDRIAFKVPVAVERKGGARVEARFDVYVEGDRALARGDDHYIRQGMTITSVSMLREKPFRGLVVVTDKHLSALLGDSENPAHTEWLPRANKVRERYHHGVSTVSFVRNSLRELTRLLALPPAGIDRNLLRDVFFVQNRTDRPDADTTGGRGKKKKETGIAPTDLPEPKRQAFKLTRVAGGFRILGVPDVIQAGAAIDIELAYEIRKGNPFKRYDKCDFDLRTKPITIRPEGVKVEERELNRLRLLVERPDFDVLVEGFDERRDLRVRALLRKEESP